MDRKDNISTCNLDGMNVVEVKGEGSTNMDLVTAFNFDTNTKKTTTSFSVSTHRNLPSIKRRDFDDYDDALAYFNTMLEKYAKVYS